MKHLAMGRRPGTPQERWRDVAHQTFDSPEAAQAWIADRPPTPEGDGRPSWEYAVVPVPE